jgi:hypothetical protein
MQEALFCQALGLTSPLGGRASVWRWMWTRSRIDLYVVWQAKSAAVPGLLAHSIRNCTTTANAAGAIWTSSSSKPPCTASCRAWPVAAAAPSPNSSVPWAREGSRFTLHV